MIGKILCTLASAALLGSGVHAQVEIFYDFAAYDAAVDGNQDVFIDFETTADGMSVVPDEDSNGDGNFDIEGSIFSDIVDYDSPDMASSRVNIADIAQGIDNEIGPFDAWIGNLRWTYDGQYVATGFTGVSMNPDARMRFLRNGQEIADVAVGGNNETFQFFGFVLDEPFDSVELEGDFFAIDAHYSTAEPPECFLVVGSGEGSATFGGAAHVWETQVADILLSYPVSLDDMPAFPLPTEARWLRQFGETATSVSMIAGGPAALTPPPFVLMEVTAQVLMWNPGVFPTNPEQFSEGILVKIWSDGTVTGETYGASDNMHIEVDTFTYSDGNTYYYFPFSIGS